MTSVVIPSQYMREREGVAFLDAYSASSSQVVRWATYCCRNQKAVVRHSSALDSFTRLADISSKQLLIGFFLLTFSSLIRFPRQSHRSWRQLGRQSASPFCWFVLNICYDDTYDIVAGCCTHYAAHGILLKAQYSCESPLL